MLVGIRAPDDTYTRCSPSPSPSSPFQFVLGDDGWDGLRGTWKKDGVAVTGSVAVLSALHFVGR